MEKYYYVYILTNKKNGVLYIGVTNDLLKRVKEHKDKAVKGFTSKYNGDKLVFYEEIEDLYSARGREKVLKYCKRQWKIDLIEKMNPEWEDLYLKLTKT